MRTALTLTILATSASFAQQPFYGDPPDENHPWAIHDRNRPQPPVVTPAEFPRDGKPGSPPSDATVLFDGTEASLENWLRDKKPEKEITWEVVDGALQCKPKGGYIRTKESFGDVQLHVEWSAPTPTEGKSQGRGNSGIFLMGMAEVQVLDNFENPTYPDGAAGSLYGVNPPMANPLRPPGEWQSYDIVFRRPLYDADEKLIDPGYMTVMINGVLVQDHQPLEGGGGHIKRSKDKKFPAAGPLKLQDHGNPVRFRNIWLRPLPPRNIEGGSQGKMSKDATLAQRDATARDILDKAADKKGVERMTLLYESLTYAANPTVNQEANTLADAFVAKLETSEGEDLEAMKWDAINLNKALRYLEKHKRISAPVENIGKLQSVIDAQEWDPKRKKK